jgi:pimeloyl-ACP methyl ester carboxylesterase
MALRIIAPLLGLLALVIFSCTGSKQAEDAPTPTEDTVVVLTGNNPAAGRYVQSGGARIYYEVYGQGAPLVLLHSDFYGYIDDFTDYIPELVKHYRVIAIGKRGHGKSEMGNTPFAEQLFADDVLAVLRQEKLERVSVLGFGGGATTAYYLAANHPKHVAKVVGLAGLLNTDGYRKGVKEDLSNLSFKQIDENAHGFVIRRRRLMPQPQRLEELLDRMKAYWLSGTFVEEAKVRRISCPVLVVTGDRDYYQGMEVAIDIQKAIPHARLKVVPGCDRAGLTLRPELLKNSIVPFL